MAFLSVSSDFSSVLSVSSIFFPFRGEAESQVQFGLILDLLPFKFARFRLIFRLCEFCRFRVVSFTGVCVRACVLGAPTTIVLLFSLPVTPSSPASSDAQPLIPGTVTSSAA